MSYALGANIENLTLTGNAAIDATGNALANTIIGNTGANTLDGGAGADTMTGGAGDDTFVFSAGFGDDTLSDFTVGVDKIDLSALDVGTFADLLANTANGDAAVVLTLADGSISLNGVAKTQLVEADFIGLTPDAIPTGSEGDDILTGSADADTIDGLGGNDAVSGLGGNDELIGGAGDDTLDGGTGADTMTGGTGDDTFVVDTAADTVNENTGEGTDAVQSSVSFTLGANVEKLTLTGSAAIDATGNALANTIVGNAGDNTLDGGTGADTLIGGAGGDTFAFSPGFGDDTLSDFTSGVDKIDLSALNVGTFADLLATTADGDGQAIITLADGSISLSGVTKAQLVEGDFIGLAADTTLGSRLN